MNGSVKLVSHSGAIGPEMQMTDIIAYCARVSNPGNQDNKDTADKLLKYLWQK